MRRTALLGIVTATALCGVIGGVAQAAPTRTPVTDPLGSGSPNGSITLPGPVICPFNVDVAVVSNGEYQTVTTLSDGTTVTNITGSLVLSFRNDTTGATIVRNLSGPTSTTVHPDGTGTEVGGGENYWIFGPRSQANTGEPGLVFTNGRVVLPFVGNVVTSFSVAGTQVNACALLAR
jgi:hypothetical protein